MVFCGDHRELGRRIRSARWFPTISVNDRQLRFSFYPRRTLLSILHSFQCLSIGNHFIASKYKRREHLLPTPDENLIRRLADLETKMPDPADVVAYAAWKDQVKSLRSQIPNPI